MTRRASPSKPLFAAEGPPHKLYRVGLEFSRDPRPLGLRGRSRIVYAAMALPHRVSFGLVCVALFGCPLQIETQQILDTVVIAEGSTCANGGQRITSGVDEDGSGGLEGAEVLSSADVCFPAPPPTPAPVVTLTSTTVASCVQVTADVGTDLNSDGVLSAGEINSSATTCIPPPPELVARFIDPPETGLTLRVRMGASPSEPNTFPDLVSALDDLRTRRKSGRVIIEMEATTWTMPAAGVSLADIDGIHLELTGPGTGTQPVLVFPGNGFFITTGFYFGVIRNLTLRNGNQGGFTYGIRVEAGARVAIENLTIEDFAVGIEALGGSVTRVPGREGVDGADVRCRSAGFTVGLWAQENGSMFTPDSRASGCTFAFWASNGSTLNADGSVAENSVVGFRAENGSFVQANRTLAQDNTAGFAVVNNSTMLVEEWSLSGGPGMNNTSDIEVRDGSMLRVVAPAATGCGNLLCDADSQVRGCGDVVCDAAVE